MARYQIIFILLFSNFHTISFSQIILNEPFMTYETKENEYRYHLSKSGDWLLNLGLYRKNNKDHLLTMYDPDNGEILWEIDPGTDEIIDATFSPDEKYIAAVLRDDGLVLIFETETGNFLKSITFGVSEARRVIFSPDGKLIAILTGGGIFIYDIASSDRVIHIFPERVNWHNITSEDWLIHNLSPIPMESVNFHPNGQFILACSPYDRSARMWDIETGERVHAFIHPGPYEFGPVLSIFNADGDTMISMDQNSTLYLWDVKSEELKHSTNIFKNTYLSNNDSFHGAFARSIVLTPQSNLFFIGGSLSGLEDARLAFFFDTETDEIKYQIDYSEEPLFVGLTSNGNLLVTRILNKLKFWDTSFIFKDHIRNWMDYK